MTSVPDCPPVISPHGGESDDLTSNVHTFEGHVPPTGEAATPLRVALAYVTPDGRVSAT